MNLYSKRKGITLMEMLVVIVLITLLSAVIVPSSVEVVSTAETNRIINNLYALRTAVLMWRKEHANWLQSSGEFKINGQGSAYRLQNNNTNDSVLHIGQYLDGSNVMKINTNGGNLREGGTYGVFDGGGGNKTSWFVGYCFTSAEKNGSVRETMRKKAASMKDDVIFLAGEYPNQAPGTGKESTVWLRVLGTWRP